MILLQWTLFYALPAATAIYVKGYFRLLKNRVMVIYVGILVSIVLMYINGFGLTWNISSLSLLAALFGGALATYLLGWNGLLYSVGAVGQQVCILLAGSYLSSGYGLVVGSIATALVFALAHRDEPERRWKLPLIFLWGCLSIALYAWLHDPLLNSGLHAAFGAILIYRGLLLTTASLPLQNSVD
jgi:hypothetical protein